jgi:hypothetical protein
MAIEGLAAPHCWLRREALMRSIAKLGMVAVAAILAGCQLTGAYRDAMYAASATPYTDQIQPRPVYFPYIFQFPDNTMFFYPIYDDNPPHSDLKLNSISCFGRTDGTVGVIANVQNLGSSLIPAIPYYFGDMGVFRVLANVTTVSGGQEELSGVQYVLVGVGGTVSVPLTTTRAKAGDIVRIDVIVDPEHIVPDPLRDNNVLSWTGTMQSASPQCTAMR